jgi:hypothetical protein
VIMGEKGKERVCVCWSAPLLVVVFLLQGRLADQLSFMLFIISGRIFFKSTEHTDRDTVR